MAFRQTRDAISREIDRLTEEIGYWTMCGSHEHATHLRAKRDELNEALDLLGGSLAGHPTELVGQQATTDPDD